MLKTQKGKLAYFKTVLLELIPAKSLIYSQPF